MPIWGGTNYPIALDTFTASPQVDNVDTVWADHPNTLAAAIEALQAKLDITDGVATGFGGISFNDLASNPGVAGVPTIWVDNSSGSPYPLMYTDDTGTDFDLTSGGGGGTLQTAYVAGNTIAATSAEGIIDFSVANTQNIPVLQLTQSDSTNHPVTLSLVNNATYSPTTGAGASVSLSGTSAGIHSTSASGMTLAATASGLNAVGFGNSGFGAYNGTLDMGSVQVSAAVDPTLYLRSYSNTTRNQYMYIQSGPTGATGGNASLSLSSVTGSNTGATTSYTTVLANSKGNNASSNADVLIKSYAQGAATAGTSTVTIQAYRNPGTGDTGSSIVLGQEIVFADQNKAASTYAGDLKLSETSAEWDTFEENYGEVSLLNAINQAAGGGGGVTLNGAYDYGGAGSGRTITVDSGAVQLTTSGTSAGLLIDGTSTGTKLQVQDASANDVFTIASTGETTVAGQGYDVTLGSAQTGASNLTVQVASSSTGVGYAKSILSSNTTNTGDATTQVYAQAQNNAAEANLDLTSTHLNAGLAAITMSSFSDAGTSLVEISADHSVGGSASVSIGSLSSSHETIIIGTDADAAFNLTLGDVAHSTTLLEGLYLRLDDGYRAGSSWTGTAYIPLSTSSAQWTSLETNCGGEVSLIQAINLAFASGPTATLQSAYEAGNSIAATAAEGEVSITVANSQNIAALSLVQNNITNNPAALIVENNASGNAITLSGGTNRVIGSDSYHLTLQTTTTGDINLLSVDNNVNVSSTSAINFGDPSTDGSWRFVRSGNNLVIERRESSAWVTKQTITP